MHSPHPALILQFYSSLILTLVSKLYQTQLLRKSISTPHFPLKNFILIIINSINTSSSNQYFQLLAFQPTQTQIANMVSFTTTFVAVIGFVSLAQPIAAAPLAMVAASAVGGLVSGHKIRDDSALWERATAGGGMPLPLSLSTSLLPTPASPTFTPLPRSFR
jgi:hypothetical protein